MHKTCSTCLRDLPITDFYKQKRGAFGVAGRCKSCARDYERSEVGRAVRARYETSAKGRAKNQRYRATEKSRIKNRRWKKTEAGQASRLREKQTEWYRQSQLRYNKSEKGRTSRNKISAKARRSDAGRARMRARRESGKAAESNRKYKRTPIGRLRNIIHCQNRRARLKSAGGSFTLEEWIDLCNRFDNRCACCQRATDLEVDHVVPIARGGTNSIDNIQPLCPTCNKQKMVRVIDYRVA